MADERSTDRQGGPRRTPGSVVLLVAAVFAVIMVMNVSRTDAWKRVPIAVIAATGWALSALMVYRRSRRDRATTPDPDHDGD